MKKLLTSLLLLSIVLGAVAQQKAYRPTNDNKQKMPTFGKTHSGPKTDPVDATIDTSQILYWVGQGSNRAVLAVNWNMPDTCLAWGIRFNGTISSQDALDTIQLYDSRFTAVHPMYVDDIHFTMDDGTVLGLYDDPTMDYNYWWINIDGVSGNNDQMTDGTIAKYGDASCGIGYDEMFGYFMEYAWVKPITPVPAPGSSEPQVTDAAINADQILYWIGEGSNEVIFAVNWNDPDTCLAWGYRFSESEILVQTVMDSIQANDPRFSYVAGTWGVDDILFSTDDLSLQLSQSPAGYNYWLYNVNGSMAQLGYNQMMLVNGDFVKWGDPEAGTTTAYDEWGYASEIAWTTTVTPVSVPETEEPSDPLAQFDGPVGSEGCMAIEYNDSRFVAWASACTIQRGYQNLMEPTALVTYGSETDAVGPVTNSSNLDVVSLGDGGVATVTFEGTIYNGEGPDFAVFENAFNDSFLELAFVEVSSDGSRFVRFPATSLTPTSWQKTDTSAMNPRYLNNLAGKYRSLWGTPFDLEELRDSAGLDVNHITHVRIIDVVGSIDPQYGTRDQYGNLINDPFPTITYSAGFDLDGVGVINFERSTVEGIADIEMNTIKVWPNPATNVLNVENGNGAQLYDMTGRLVMTLTSDKADISHLNNGIYMLRQGSKVTKVVKK